MHECDFPEFQIRGMVLQHQRLHHTFTFFVTEKVYAFFDFLKCMNTIFRGFQMTVTVLQHLRLHKWFTFSALGDKRSAARDERIRRPGAAGDRGKFE